MGVSKKVRGSWLKVAIICAIIRLPGARLAVAANRSPMTLTNYSLQPTLVFSMTVTNPSHETRHLIKVGVSSAATGDFNCLSGAEVLLPLADYIVRFYVRTPMTTIKADPVIRVEPNGSASFTISLVPDATGSCGYWSSNVQAVADFDDGTVLLSARERITAEDVAKATSRLPTQGDVVRGLSHPDVGMRLQSLNWVPRLHLGSDDIVALVRTRLSDPSDDVRAAAVSTVINSKWNGLFGQAITVYYTVTSDESKRTIAEALAARGVSR